jgi:hypothetical protein
MLTLLKYVCACEIGELVAELVVGKRELLLELQGPQKKVVFHMFFTD